MEKKKKKHKKREISESDNNMNNCGKEKGSIQHDELYNIEQYLSDNLESNNIIENQNIDNDYQKHITIKKKNCNEKRGKNLSNSFEDNTLEFLPQNVDDNSNNFQKTEINKIEENNLNSTEAIKMNKKKKDINNRSDSKDNDCKCYDNDNADVKHTENDFEKNGNHSTNENDKNKDLLAIEENINDHFESSDGYENEHSNKSEKGDEYENEHSNKSEKGDKPENEHSNKSTEMNEHGNDGKKRSVKDNVYEDFIREYKNLQSLFAYNKTIIKENFNPMPTISEENKNGSDIKMDKKMNKTEERNNHSDFSNQLNYPTNNNLKDDENKSRLSEQDDEIEEKSSDNNFGEGKEHEELKKEIKNKESENRENKKINKQKETSDINAPESEENIILEKEKDSDSISKKKENLYMQKKNTNKLQKGKEQNSSSNISVASIINDNFDNYNISKNNSISKIDKTKTYNDLTKKKDGSIDNNEYKNDASKNYRPSIEINKSKNESDNIKIKKAEKQEGNKMNDHNFNINFLDESIKDNSKTDLFLNISSDFSKHDNNDNDNKLKGVKNIEVNSQIKKTSKHRVIYDDNSEVDEMNQIDINLNDHENYNKINNNMNEQNRKGDIKKKKVEKKKKNSNKNTFISNHLNDDNISLSYFTEENKKEDYDSIHEIEKSSNEYIHVNNKKDIRDNKETNKYKNIDPTIMKKIKNINKGTGLNINNRVCKLNSPIKEIKQVRNHKEIAKKKTLSPNSSFIKKKKHIKHSTKKNKKEDDANDSKIKKWESKFVEENEEMEEENEEMEEENEEMEEENEEMEEENEEIEEEKEEDNELYWETINEKKKKKKKYSKKKKSQIMNESFNNSISSVDDIQSEQEEDENDKAMQLSFFNFFDKKKKKKKKHSQKSNDILKENLKLENDINNFFISFWDNKNLKKNNKEDLYNFNNENNTKDIHSINKIEKKMSKQYIHTPKEDNLNEQIDILRKKNSQNNILQNQDKYIDEKKGKHSGKDKDKFREKDKMKYRDKISYINYEHNRSYIDNKHKYKKNYLENYDELYNYSIEEYNNNYSSSEHEKRENELKKIYNKNERKYLDGIILNKNYDESINNVLKKKDHKNEEKENNYFFQKNNDNSTVHNNSGYATKSLGFFSSNFFHLKRLLEKKNVETNDPLKRENELDKFYEKNEKKKSSSFDIFQKFINNKGHDMKCGKISNFYKRESHDYSDIYYTSRGKESFKECIDPNDTEQISDAYSEYIEHFDIDKYGNFRKYKRNKDDKNRKYYKDRHEYHENEKHEKNSKHKKPAEYKCKKINKELLNDRIHNIEYDDKSLNFQKKYISNLTRTDSNETMVNEFSMDKLNHQSNNEDKNENNNDFNKYENNNGFNKYENNNEFNKYENNNGFNKYENNNEFNKYENNNDLKKYDEFYENSESFLYSVDNFKIVKNILLSLELTNDDKISKIRKILFYSPSEEKKKIMDEILNTLYMYPQLYVSCIICLFYLFILDNDLFERNFSSENLIYLFNPKIDFRYAEWFLKTYLFYKFKFSNSSNSDDGYNSYICENDSIGKEKVAKIEKGRIEKGGDINSLVSEKDDIEGNKKIQKIKNTIYDNFFESYNSSGDSMDNYLYYQNDKIEEQNKINESNKKLERKIDKTWNKIETNEYVGYNECKMLLKICLSNEQVQNIKLLSESKIRSLVISIWLNIRCSRPQKYFLKLIYNWINNKNDDFNKKKNLFNLLKAEKKYNKNITKACFNYFLKFLIKYKENCSNDIIYTLYLIDENELKLYSKKFIEKNQININQFISIWNIMCILFWDTKKIHNFTFFKKNNNNYYYDFMLIFLKNFYEYIFPANSQIVQNIYLKKTININSISTINLTNQTHNQFSSKLSSSYPESKNKENYNDESDYFNLFDVENIIKDFNFNDISNIEVNTKNFTSQFRDNNQDFIGTNHSETMESETREVEQSVHAKENTENTNGIKNMLKFIIQKIKKEKNIISCVDINEIKMLIFLGICIKIVICRISNLLNSKTCLEQFYYFINHKILGLRIFKHSHIILIYFIPFFKKYYFLWKFIEHEIDPEIIKLINAIINNLESLQINKNINNIENSPKFHPYIRSNTSLPKVDHLFFPSKDNKLNNIFSNFNMQSKPHNYKTSFSHSTSIESNNNNNNFKQNNISLSFDMLISDSFNVKNNKKNSEKFGDTHSNENQRYFHDYSELGCSNKSFHANLTNNINYLQPNSIFKLNEKCDQVITYDDMFRDDDDDYDYDHDYENNYFDKNKSKIHNVKEYITNLHFNNLPNYLTSLKNENDNKKIEDKKKKKKKLKDHDQSQNKNKNSKEQENGKEENRNSKTQLKEYNNISKLIGKNENIPFYNIPDNENSENKISKIGNSDRKYLFDNHFDEYKNGNKKCLKNNYNHKEGSANFEEYKYKENSKSNIHQNNGINKFPTISYENVDNLNHIIDKKTQKEYLNLEMNRKKKESFSSSKRLTNIESVKDLNSGENNNEIINDRKSIQTNVHITNYIRNHNNIKSNEYEQFLREKNKNKKLEISQRNGISIVNSTTNNNYEEINIINSHIEKKKQDSSDKLIQKRPKYLMLPIDMIELKKMQKGKLRHPPVGLINLGNTCYLNSLLQALYSTVSFVVNLYIFNIDDNEKIMNLNHQSSSNIISIKNKLLFNSNNLNNPNNPNINDSYTNLLSKRFLYELKILFKLMSTTNKKYVSPYSILSILPQELNNRNQQDVTELFRYTFEQLGGSEKRFLRLIFSGVVIQKVQCQKCFFISKKEEIIHDLSFHVPAKSTKKESIQKFFDTYIQKEKIYGNNKYKCSKCNKRRNALKWNEIISPPCHLILILNRYNWSFTSNEKKKIKTHVKINKKIVVNNFDYKLYGGIIHSGVSASSGHYYFIGKKSEKCDNSKNEWYQMDDSVITKVSSKSINRISKDLSNDHTPYVLFYRCKQAPVSPSLYF